MKGFLKLKSSLKNYPKQTILNYWRKSRDLIKVFLELSEGFMKIALNMLPLNGFGVQGSLSKLNCQFVAMSSESKNQG